MGDPCTDQSCADSDGGRLDQGLKLGTILIMIIPMNLIFKALGHPVRRQIVDMLRNGPLSSGEIADAFDMAWPSVTGHLAALKEAGLVEAERDGTTIRYRLNISAAEEALGFLLGVVQPLKRTMKAPRRAGRARPT